MKTLPLASFLPVNIAPGLSCIYLRGAGGVYLLKTIADTEQDRALAVELEDLINRSAAATPPAAALRPALADAISWLEENAEELERAGLEWQGILRDLNAAHLAGPTPTTATPAAPAPSLECVDLLADALEYVENLDPRPLMDRAVAADDLAFAEAQAVEKRDELTHAIRNALQAEIARKEGITVDSPAPAAVAALRNAASPHGPDRGQIRPARRSRKRARRMRDADTGGGTRGQRRHARRRSPLPRPLHRSPDARGSRAAGAWRVLSRATP